MSSAPLPFFQILPAADRTPGGRPVRPTDERPRVHMLRTETTENMDGGFGFN